MVDESSDRVVETGNGTPDLLDAQTGRLVKRWPSAETSCMPTAIDSRRGWIYTLFTSAGRPTSHSGGTTAQLVALDGRTGTILHRFPAPANASALAVDSQTGRVLVGSTGTFEGIGTVYGRGTPTSSGNVSAGGSSGTGDLPDSHASFNGGAVSVLDRTTGRVLRTLQVGFAPSDIAIDAPHRRALVVSSYSFSDEAGNDTAIAWRPRESWWRPVLRRIKQVICCLPFQAPAPPAPTDGTVTTIDLSRL